MDRETLIDAAEEALANRHDMDVAWRTYAEAAVDAVLAAQREDADETNAFDGALHHLQADGALDRGFLAEAIRSKNDAIAALQARVAELSESLRDARDNGLIWWGITTTGSALTKKRMLARIDRALRQGGDDGQG